MTYPRTAGHLAGSATSEAAAQHVDETYGDSQLREVEKLAHIAKYQGVTADEMRPWLAALWPGTHNAIVSARLAALVRQGKVVKTVRQRKATTGRQQQVYVHADFADMEQAAPQSAKAKTDFLKEIDPVLRALCSVLDEGKTARLEPNGPFHNKLKERFL